VNNTRSKITPGVRLPDGDGTPVTTIGQYKRDSRKRLVCMPPYAGSPITLARRPYKQRRHSDGTISVKVPISVNSTSGLWIGVLSQGFWIEQKFTPYRVLSAADSFFDPREDI
jgi:hypothetical protein